MKLVVHAGTHKTASSTFQAVLTACRDELVKSGVIYPDIRGWPQHSRLAWLLQAGEEEQLSALLGDCVAQAKRTGCQTVLLSGEDFENCLVDFDAAHRFDALARQQGINEIDWIFVARDPFDYLLSIYGTMSKQRVCLNLDEMARILRSRGYLSASNSSYNYHFVFDVRERSKRFAEAVSGDVRILDFAAFTTGFVGSTLLRQLVTHEASWAVVSEIARNVKPLNRRKTAAETERGYAMNALGIPVNDTTSYLEHKELVDAIAAFRLKRTEAILPGMAQKIRKANQK